MNIHHSPIFDRDKIIKHYTEKDGVEVKYVCTTDLRASDVPVDVYYRETPHPQFGNRYFGIYYSYNGDLMITNADSIESLIFGMIKVNGDYHYSQSRHDFKKFEDGQYIDGGRNYVRSNVSITQMVVKDGKFIYNN